MAHAVTGAVVVHGYGAIVDVCGRGGLFGAVQSAAHMKDSLYS